MDPMRNNYNKIFAQFYKLSVKNPKDYQELKLSFYWPKAKDKHSLACRGCYLAYHIENGHFTLAETTESLKINEALKFLSTG